MVSTSSWSGWALIGLNKLLVRVGIGRKKLQVRVGIGLNKLLVRMGIGRKKLLVRVGSILDNLLIGVGIGLNKLLVRVGSDKFLVIVEPWFPRVGTGQVVR